MLHNRFIAKALPCAFYVHFMFVMTNYHKSLHWKYSSIQIFATSKFCWTLPMVKNYNTHIFFQNACMILELALANIHSTHDISKAILSLRLHSFHLNIKHIYKTHPSYRIFSITHFLWNNKNFTWALSVFYKEATFTATVQGALQRVTDGVSFTSSGVTFAHGLYICNSKNNK